eukprot:TRINITY_DN85103_c0_g1_i1.p1 TRINITY_DN85103_c0_g1~~TRINITY_DN85103_c0_g1_i1.p1  ORF type:complete len:116 (+),score=23.65 TRINITY_DN85103_c0_g1_i1:59-406(+)
MQKGEIEWLQKARAAKDVVNKCSEQLKRFRGCSEFHGYDPSECKAESFALNWCAGVVLAMQYGVCRDLMQSFDDHMRKPKPYTPADNAALNAAYKDWQVCFVKKAEGVMNSALEP